jgi:DNA-binding CsgD family transcriptional regulator
MSLLARNVESLAQLRVAIHATDPSRGESLRRLVVEAGHVVVSDRNSADVILSDGDFPSPAIRPTVTLGGTAHELPGVLSRNANSQQIDAALRAVAVGLIVRSPDLTDIGFGSMPEHDVALLLTPRELEILSAIADGDTNKAIARRLNISLHTVKFHVESVFRKLGARTRTEAVAKASERRRKETIKL